MMLRTLLLSLSYMLSVDALVVPAAAPALPLRRAASVPAQQQPRSAATSAKTSSLMTAPHTDGFATMQTQDESAATWVRRSVA